MKRYFDNLRPFERRVVVGVGVLLFFFLNVWIVFPHFSDWSNVQNRIHDARAKLVKYQAETNQIPIYDKLVRELLGENQDVPAEEQQNQFSRVALQQAGQSGVNVTTTSKIITKTNQFFLELSQTIGADAGEHQLVDFLYNLGSGTSLIRARDMSLHPDPSRQKLNASLTLVASYQKALPLPRGVPGVKPGPASKPVTASVP